MTDKAGGEHGYLRIATKKAFAPSEMFDLKNNFHIACSGMAWEPTIKFSRNVLGEDRVLNAMDYP